ncbi:hypothetical protein NDK50_19695 [Paraburkholderia bryophila]|uniref:hypothetical protein n=1 Tax=Paraburkholderia bryophila TaxID=420952 RepID=UPI00234A9A04|nr:hypothetical protein [Paraburkholderia bryophila]WCM19604.1 hypothetical protein NDK50_19695 [Paraburkholderia bryophila]
MAISSKGKQDGLRHGNGAHTWRGGNAQASRVALPGTLAGAHDRNSTRTAIRRKLQANAEFVPVVNGG